MGYGYAMYVQHVNCHEYMNLSTNMNATVLPKHQS